MRLENSIKDTYEKALLDAKARVNLVMPNIPAQLDI